MDLDRPWWRSHRHCPLGSRSSKSSLNGKTLPKGKTATPGSGETRAEKDLIKKSKEKRKKPPRVTGGRGRKKMWEKNPKRTQNTPPPSFPRVLTAPRPCPFPPVHG